MSESMLYADVPSQGRGKQDEVSTYGPGQLVHCKALAIFCARQALHRRLCPIPQMTEQDHSLQDDQNGLPAKNSFIQQRNRHGQIHITLLQFQQTTCNRIILTNVLRILSHILWKMERRVFERQIQVIM